MQISYVEPMRMICPDCGDQMVGDIIHVLDSAERPDIWARCLRDGINTLCCRKGHTLTPAIAVMAHDRTRRRVLFCPSDGTADASREMDIVEPMLARIYQGMSNQQDLDYLGNIEVVALKYLPHALLLPAHTIQTILSCANLPMRLLTFVTVCKEVISRQKEQPGSIVLADFDQWLGEGLLCTRGGRRSSNIKEAVSHFQNAQLAYTADAHPRRHADLDICLATAYATCLEDSVLFSEMLEDLNTAEHFLRKALGMLTPECTPKAWVKAQLRLSCILLARVELSDRRRVHEALSSITEVKKLEFAGCDLLEQLVAVHIANRLAELADRPPHTRHEANQNPLVKTFKDVLSKLADRFWSEGRLLPATLLPFATSSITAAGHIRMLYNKATELLQQRDVEVAHYIEDAIRYLEAAEQRIDGYTTEANVELIANTMKLLGDSYAERYGGNRTENLRASIRSLEFATGLYATEKLISGQNRSLSSLGASYRALGEQLSEGGADPKRAADAHAAKAKAIISLEKAATLLDELQGTEPVLALAIYNNLGNVYASYADIDDESLLKKAAAAFAKALDATANIIDRPLVSSGGAKEHVYELAADIRSNLGRVYLRLEPLDHNAGALGIEQLVLALRYYQRMHLYADVRRVALDLHTAYRKEGRLEEAIGVLEDAIAVADILRDDARGLERQQQELAWSFELYKSAAVLSLSLTPPQPKRALEYSDNMRFRWLRTSRPLAELGTSRESAFLAKSRGKSLNWLKVHQWLKSRRQKVGIIEFLMVEEEVIAFFAASWLDEPQVYHIPVGISRLAQIVNLCISEVHYYTPGFPAPGIWAKEATILFEPLIDRLVGLDLLYWFLMKCCIIFLCTQSECKAAH